MGKGFCEIWRIHAVLLPLLERTAPLELGLCKGYVQQGGHADGLGGRCCVNSYVTVLCFPWLNFERWSRKRAKGKEKCVVGLRKGNWGGMVVCGATVPRFLYIFLERMHSTV
jgi:hypothetical protein